MAFREVPVFEVREVLRLWLDGEGLRSIERLCTKAIAARIDTTAIAISSSSRVKPTPERTERRLRPCQLRDAGREGGSAVAAYGCIFDRRLLWPRGRPHPQGIGRRDDNVSRAPRARRPVRYRARRPYLRAWSCLGRSHWPAIAVIRMQVLVTMNTQLPSITL